MKITKQLYKTHKLYIPTLVYDRRIEYIGYKFLSWNTIEKQIRKQAPYMWEIFKEIIIKCE